MSREVAAIPTEPGSRAARLYGCTCPDERPVPIAGGGIAYARAEDCPLHRMEQAAGSWKRARVQEARRASERAAS